MSLRWKILLPIAILGAVLTAGSWMAVARLASRSGEDRALRLLADASRQASDSLVRSEDQLLSIQRLVVNTEGVADGVAASDSEDLRAIVLPLSLFTHADLVAVLDPQGTSLLVVRRPAGAPPGEYETLRGESYFAEWDFVQRLLAGEQDPELGDKQVGFESMLLGQDEQFVFFVGGPVRNVREQVVGAVLAGSYLDRLVATTAEQAGSNVSFYELGSGRLLATTLESADPAAFALDSGTLARVESNSSSAPVRSVTSAETAYEESVVPFTAMQGKVTLAAVGVAVLAADPGSTDWISSAGLLAPYVAAGWLIAAIAGWLVATRITARLHRLAESPLLAQEDGTDEIALLSRSWTNRIGRPAPARELAETAGEPAEDLLRTQPAIRLGGKGTIYHGPAAALSVHISLPNAAELDGASGLLAEAVRDLVATLPDIVQKHRGVLVALDEVGLVALFGLPPRAMPVPVSVLLAGHAAFAISEHVSRLTLAANGAGKLIARSGLHAGEITAFAVGGKDHRKWVGVGATLDLAKELDELGRRGGQPSVAMSGQAYDALGGARSQFEFGRYGQVRLARGAGELMVYEVLRRKETLVRQRVPAN